MKLTECGYNMAIRKNINVKFWIIIGKLTFGKYVTTAVLTCKMTTLRSGRMTVLCSLENAAKSK